MTAYRTRLEQKRCTMRAVVVCCLAMSMLLFAPPAADAVEEQNNVTHLFNATLSLTGDCATSTADPVPDPGCPTAAHPPEGKLTWPSGVATDAHGDIYVANNNTSQGEATFNVDIFDPTGHYLTEVTRTRSGEVNSHANVAVDSTGHLYLFDQLFGGGTELIRYDPTLYKPEAGEIAYGSPPVTISTKDAFFAGLAVDPTNDHLYVRSQAAKSVSEYAAAVNGVKNELIAESIGAGTLNHESFGGANIALNAARHRIYVADVIGSNPPEKAMVRVFSTEAPYELLETINGSTIPAGQFVTKLGSNLALAVDESTGEVIVGDMEGKKIYVFDEDGEYVETIKKPIFDWDFVSFAVDNSEESPNQGFLFVPSGASASAGHLYAYEPKRQPKPPVVEAVSVRGLGEEEAVLRARINPKGISAHYVLEYVTQRAFEAEGFAGASLAGEGTIGASNEGVSVSAPAAGLVPGTAYRFRAVAENQCEPGGCTGELQGTFTTFPRYAQSGSCLNQALRTGPSAALPDCRAYELVTPANTGGFAPFAPGVGVGDFFATPPASPEGDSVAFLVAGGLIPGLENPGSFEGDAYRAIRTASGWRSEGIGPNGAQAARGEAGSLSADHSFFAVRAAVQGSLVIEGTADTDYVRYPDGSFHLTGEGSPGNDPEAQVRYIAPHGTHIIFVSNDAIYDRTPDGATHFVGNGYLGSSANGSVIAFENGQGSIGLRVDDERTLEATPSGATFAGLSGSGRYLFYLKGGDLFRFYTESEETERVTETGDATPVFVPGDGTATYFVSSDALPSPGAPAENPLGKTPIPPAKGTGVLGAKGTGVLSAAKGTGTLTSDSVDVTGVSTSEGAFEVGMQIFGTGIPEGTTIKALGSGTLTLSRPATQSGATSLTAGSTLLTGVSTSEGAFEVGMQISGTGIPEGTTIKALGPGTLTLSKPTTQSGPSALTATGSTFLTGVSTSEGAFEVGMHISGAGIPKGTTITAVDEGAHTLTLSQKATASGSQELSAGAQNLYYWHGSTVRFVATLTEGDVKGEFSDGEFVGGFDEWSVGVGGGAPGADPARATPSGSSFLFVSRADLSGFESGGKAEIYRYDADEPALSCLSCDPTGERPSGDARLLSLTGEANPPLNRNSLVPNLSPDGRRAFFETPERLVPADNNGLEDVYEWEAEGKGSCTTPGGCLFLISSGQSAHPNHLFGVSESGDDVFILTSDLLTAEDRDETPSVYDARVEGGFPAPIPPPAECLGEACQPAVSPPGDPVSVLKGNGNQSAGSKRACPRRKHRVRRHDKTRCVATRHKRPRHHEHRPGHGKRRAH